NNKNAAYRKISIYFLILSKYKDKQIISKFVINSIGKTTSERTIPSDSFNQNRKVAAL
ncbi:hypothetical protein DFO70_113141, partial [Cytobacillus firmus]